MMQADGRADQDTTPLEAGTSATPTSDGDDPSLKAVDRASDMYVSSEQEHRSRRFERAIKKASTA